MATGSDRVVRVALAVRAIDWRRTAPAARVRGPVGQARGGRGLAARVAAGRVDAADLEADSAEAGVAVEDFAAVAAALAMSLRLATGGGTGGGSTTGTSR